MHWKDLLTNNTFATGVNILIWILNEWGKYFFFYFREHFVSQKSALATELWLPASYDECMSTQGCSDLWKLLCLQITPGLKGNMYTRSIAKDVGRIVGLGTAPVITWLIVLSANFSRASWVLKWWMFFHIWRGAALSTLSRIVSFQKPLGELVDDKLYFCLSTFRNGN